MNEESGTPARDPTGNDDSSYFREADEKSEEYDYLHVKY